MGTINKNFDDVVCDKCKQTVSEYDCIPAWKLDSRYGKEAILCNNCAAPLQFKEIRFVQIDTTINWKEEFLAELGIKKVMSTYCYNPNEATNLCELAASYYLQFIDDIPLLADDNELTDEQFDEFNDASISGNIDGSDIYIHCREIDNMPFETMEIDTDDITESISLLDLAQEEYQKNPFYC